MGDEDGARRDHNAQILVGGAKPIATERLDRLPQPAVARSVLSRHLAWPSEAHARVRLEVARVDGEKLRAWDDGRRALV